MVKTIVFVAQSTVSINVVTFQATIPANQNSVTVTHNLSRLAKIFGKPYPTGDFSGDIKIINETVNSFDIAFNGGVTQGIDSVFEGNYV